MTDAEQIVQILALEARRCSALEANDLETLGELVADDLVHIHTNGLVDNRESYLHGVANLLEFLWVKRLGLNVRVIGPLAIVTGKLDQGLRFRQTGQNLEVKALVTQVWAERAGAWKQVSFHASVDTFA